MTNAVGWPMRRVAMAFILTAIGLVVVTPLPADDNAGSAASPIEVVWAKGVPKGLGASQFVSVAQDSAGNTYAAGWMKNETSGLGDGVSVRGRPDVRINPLLVKYGPSGKTFWARSATEGDAESQFKSVAVDAAGNAYVVGVMQKGTIGFGGAVRGEGVNEGWNLLIVKYDSKGSAQWARTLASSDGESDFGSVAVDKRGDIYAAGLYAAPSYGTVDLTNKAPGYFAVPSKASGASALLAKYDSTGRVLWAAQVSGADFSGVAVDGSGNAYVAGRINGPGTFDFGNGLLLIWSSPCMSAVLAKYSPSGKALWARFPASASHNCSYDSVALDKNGNIYVAGYLAGQSLYGFGNGVTAHGPSPKENALTIKYDARGTAVWARTLASGPGDFNYHACAVDDQFVYLAGSLRVEPGGETYDFGLTPPIRTGNVVGYLEFLVAYDLSGVARWVLMPFRLGSSHCTVMGICPASAGNLILAGDIYGTGAVDLGNGVTVDCIGKWPNLFVSRYKVLPVASGSRK